MRDNFVRCRTTTFGLRLISYLGSKPWNDLSNDFTEMTDFTNMDRISNILLTLDTFINALCIERQSDIYSGFCDISN